MFACLYRLHNQDDAVEGERVNDPEPQRRMPPIQHAFQSMPTNLPAVQAAAGVLACGPPSKQRQSIRPPMTLRAWLASSDIDQVGVKCDVVIELWQQRSMFMYLCLQNDEPQVDLGELCTSQP